jgi:hypothetical protein
MGTSWKENKTWPEGHRGCTKCGEVKLFEAFHKHSQCTGGYNSVCKQCRGPVSKNKYQEESQEQRIWYRAKGRAKRNNLEFNIEVNDILIPEKCPVFDFTLKVNDPDCTPSIDRINPALGYVKGNIQIISNRANRIKNNATWEEILLVANFIKASKEQQCEI